MRQSRFRWSAFALLALSLVAKASLASGECVVLLHGLARTSDSMAKIEDALRASGYSTANVDYPSREHTIEALAPEAVERGLDACRVRGPRTIHFVTHSLGGILVRYYLRDHAIPELGRVVMLGPPNQGSEVIDRFGDVPGFGAVNGPAGGQLGTGEGSVPLALGPVSYPVGVIAGTKSINPILSSALPDPDDGKVSVERTRVEGMSDFIAIESSHPFLMRNAEAIRQTLAFLGNGAFIHDTP
jgi:pimeloyl-ACP methyl ester carboxylesterase